MDARELEQEYYKRWEPVMKELGKICNRCAYLKGRYCFKRWMDVMDNRDSSKSCTRFTKKADNECEINSAGKIKEGWRRFDGVKRRIYIAMITDNEGVAQQSIRFSRDSAERWLEEKRREYGVTRQETTKTI